MKTTRKNFLGLLGLFLVAAITAFAALMPTPGAPTASALSAASERISVRVVGSGPEVSFIGIENNKVYNEPHVNVSFNYNGVKAIRVTMEHTDPLGNVHTYDLDSQDVDYAAGTWSRTFDLSEEPFTRGTYRIHAYGSDYTAGPDSPLHDITEDVIEFAYHPGGVTPGTDPEPGTDPTKPGQDDPGNTNPTNPDENSNVILDLGLEPNDPFTKKVIVNVYRADGSLVKEFSPTEVLPPFELVSFPFAEYGMPSGTYTFEIIEYGENNVEIYRYNIEFEYTAIVIPVPNTGAVLADLDISRTDNVITGIIVFGLVALVSLVIVARGRKQRTRSAKKRS